MKQLLILLLLFYNSLCFAEQAAFDGKIYDPDLVEEPADDIVIDKAESNKLFEAAKNNYSTDNKSVGVAAKALASDTISAHAFMNLLFGTPEEGGSLNTYLSQSKPVGFLAPFLNLLITLSGWALFIVVLVTAIRATIDTNKDYEFLGKSISTPFFFVRIGIATALLMPTGNGYTVLQTLILYSNGKVITSLDSVYGEVVDNSFSINTIETDGAPRVSKVDYQSLLQSAVCHEVFYGNGPGAVLATLSNSGDNGYSQKAGKELKIRGGYIFGKVSKWYNIFSSGDSVEGACGAFSFSGAKPIVNSNDHSALSELNKYVGQAITRLIDRDVTSISATFNRQEKYTLNITDPIIKNKFNDAKTLWYIARNIVSSDDYDPVQFVKDFDLSWAAVNRSISYNHKLELNHLRCLIGASVTNIPDCSSPGTDVSDKLIREIKDDGWLMAGANLFKLMTIQSSLSAVNRISYSSFGFNHDEIDESDADDITAYMQRFVKKVLPVNVNGGSSTTAEIPEFDVFQYLGEDKEYADRAIAICMDPTSSNECISNMVFYKAVSFLYHMSHDPGVVTPLNMFHSYGTTGVDDVWSSYLVATSINMGVKVVGYLLIGIDTFGSAAVGNTLNDFADRIYTANTSILKVLGGIFLVFAWLFPMVPVIAWIIAIADWAVTMFVMIFAAPLFAVFHALPDGNGFSSQFAQRGYPSLLGAIFFPYFMLAGLFIFVVLSYAVFRVFGYVFLKAFEAMHEISTIDLFGSIFLWGILLLTLVMIFNHLALIITNGPDRILRTLGVNEALTSGGNHQQVASQAQGQADQLQSGAQDLTKPISPGLQKDYSKETTPPPQSSAGSGVGDSSGPGNSPQSRQTSEDVSSGASNRVDAAQDTQPKSNSRVINDGQAFETGNEPGSDGGSGGKVPVDPASKTYSSDAKAPLSKRAGTAIKSGLAGALGAGVTVRGDAKREINAMNQPYIDADIAQQKARDQKAFDEFNAANEQASQDKLADEMRDAAKLDRQSAIEKNQQSSLQETDDDGNLKTNIDGAQADEASKGSNVPSDKMGDALGGYDKPKEPDSED